MKDRMIIAVLVIALFLPCSTMAQPTPVEEKVGVLITAWGLTAGNDFAYAWNLAMNSIGDKTEYEGQPCKAEFHLGPFPFQSHMNIQPFAVLHKVTGLETVFDGYGIYKFVDGVFESIHPDGDPVLPGDIPPGIPVIPLVEVTDSSGELTYPPDPNTGEDHVAGWFKIGQGSPSSMSFPNGLHDFREEYPARFAIVYDENKELARQFDIVAMPSSYVIGRDGRIAARHMGFKVKQQDEYEALIVDALQESEKNHE